MKKVVCEDGRIAMKDEADRGERPGWGFLGCLADSHVETIWGLKNPAYHIFANSCLGWLICGTILPFITSTVFPWWELIITMNQPV